MKRTKYKWKPKRKRTALQRWFSSLRACRPTPVSARQLRKVRHQLYIVQPKSHKKLKGLAREFRVNTRTLNAARVEWSRKMWEARRAAGGKGVFVGSFIPSPRRSLKWMKRSLLESGIGTTRTVSPKLRFKRWKLTKHPLHQSRRIDTAPRTGCYAQVRAKEKNR